jgi:hypothetical protein
VVLETGIIGGEWRAVGVSCCSAFSPDGFNVYLLADDRGQGGCGFPPTERASSPVLFSEYIPYFVLWIRESGTGLPTDCEESCFDALLFCDVLYDAGRV